MSLRDLEDSFDIAARKRDQQRCYRCDRIAFAAFIVWICIVGCAATAFLGWVLYTDQEKPYDQDSCQGSWPR